MIVQQPSKYGIPTYDEDSEYKSGPEGAIFDFIRGINNAGEDKKELFLKDLHTPGTRINFSGSIPDAYDMTSVVHGKFPLSEISVENDDCFELPEKGEGIILEHLASGYSFLVYEEDGEFEFLMVNDFSGSKDEPKNIRIANQFEVIEDLWFEVAPDSLGTRMGGVPLNTDGTLYAGPWPHAKDGYFSFIGQYQLPDGRYIHQFSNYNAENYDYSVMGDSDIDPYSVALVEGEPATEGVTLSLEGQRDILYPDVAYAQKRHESVKAYPPVWIQDEPAVKDVDYKFLLGFGDRQGPIEADEFHYGDMYLFWNPKNGTAHILMQCS